MNAKLISTAMALIVISILAVPSIVLADNGKGTNNSSHVVVQPGNGPTTVANQPASKPAATTPSASSIIMNPSMSNITGASQGLNQSTTTLTLTEQSGKIVPAAPVKPSTSSSHAVAQSGTGSATPVNQPAKDSAKPATNNVTAQPKTTISPIIQATPANKPAATTPSASSIIMNPSVSNITGASQGLNPSSTTLTISEHNGKIVPTAPVKPSLSIEPAATTPSASSIIMNPSMSNITGASQGINQPNTTLTISEQSGKIVPATPVNPLPANKPATTNSSVSSAFVNPSMSNITGASEGINQPNTTLTMTEQFGKIVPAAPDVKPVPYSFSTTPTYQDNVYSGGTNGTIDLLQRSYSTNNLTTDTSAATPASNPVMQNAAMNTAPAEAKPSLSTKIWNTSDDAEKVLETGIPAIIKASVPTPTASTVLNQTKTLGNIAATFAVFDYIKAANKENVTLRDMGDATWHIKDNVVWMAHNKDAAFSAVADGAAKAGAVSWNGMMETSGASLMIRIATNGAHSGQTSSQQIQNAGQKVTDYLWDH
jgi:hypothetical protein